MGFSEILAEYLQLNNLTQTGFAKMVGVKQSQVSEWLKGKAKPSYDLLKQIINGTGQSPSFWLGLDE